MDFYYFDPESFATLHSYPYRSNNHKELIELTELEYLIISIVRRFSIISVGKAILRAQRLLGDV